ncbi:lipoprotein [Microbulbifer agarilyticus]|uniref:LPS translocon maturation chaperone LptM n=1 Tax=Microbulbifer agarilyticus TaxID=260552 RepID=UPI001C9799F0|nr:lipoprotein [Microbulbifer agarilyticus]MBY6190653.1 lipoprotein [Microbulbifer agarilyticus]MBY6211257.1 lipoprotein [Microbulbifer agarilyticus]
MRTQLISLTAIVALSATLGACGQKGPLYLPQDPAAPGATGAPRAASTTTGGHSHGQPVNSSEEKRNKADSAQQEQDNHQQHTEAEAVSK